jgi:hypothetical protein
MSTPPSEFADLASEAPPRRPAARGERGETPWSPLLRYGMWVVLLAMALADAFGFWTTLIRIIRRDTDLVLAFVVALGIGAVFGAHEVGRLARSRREGRGGSVLWIVAVALSWLGLGLVIAWMRTLQPTSTVPLGSGLLSTPAQSIDVESVQLAALLLILYLLTGALAMTHGYRFGDPRTVEFRAAVRLRERLQREAAERLYSYRLAEQLLTERRGQLARDDEAHERRVEETEALAALLREEARLQQMGHHGDPPTTDGLRSNGRQP